ncbi:hypothetical protein O181_071230 [Austropuccinia psidii MF-1]|uniref:Uncharacterized protein n=1 Tax=Austropuccinia psidii MF-1 TaxID=1389203 RepID=A0A9Q3F6C0_9BASI|nr:hypothetical protein [Austropuccinia psidii MF-1]
MPHASHLAHPRLISTSIPYTEKRKSNLPTIVNIFSQIPTLLHQEIPRNTTPMVLGPRTLAWGLMERMLNDLSRKWKLFQKLKELVSDVMQEKKIEFWTKDEEISYHIERMCNRLLREIEGKNKKKIGKVSPERRCRLSSIAELLTKNLSRGEI